MNKIILGIVVVAILGGGIWYFSSSKPLDYKNSATPTQQEVAIKKEMKIFSVTDVATHNSEASCYTIVRGNVYDVTAFIPKHPGGSDAVLAGCGVDNTETFVKKHGGKEEMETVLETMKVGTLAK